LLKQKKKIISKSIKFVLMKNLSEITIALASDHAGFDRKMTIIRYFNEMGIRYYDFGCYSSESVDFPDFAHPLSKAINDGEYPVAITFCGSGQGINIVANKYPNNRSALCWNPEIARLAVEHNKANICAIPGRFVSDEEAIQIVEAFLGAEFEGGRHIPRVEKIPIH
jgi:ribose 5-phosphate isomerase B